LSFRPSKVRKSSLVTIGLSTVKNASSGRKNGPGDSLLLLTRAFLAESLHTPPESLGRLVRRKVGIRLSHVVGRFPLGEPSMLGRSASLADVPLPNGSGREDYQLLSFEKEYAKFLVDPH
jgi:hypothetical protein